MTDSRLQEAVERILDEEHIAVRAWMRFSDCRVTSDRILRRRFPDVLPEAALLFLVPYYPGDDPRRNVSLYAVGRDYHVWAKMLSDKVAGACGNAAAVFSDTSPIDERHAALTAGLGTAGDNGLILHEKYGSYLFIGEVLTAFSPAEGSLTQPGEIRTCRHCGACRRACPDPQSCLSARTQEKGELSEYTRSQMKQYHTAWGCDLCQTSCPYNRGVPVTPIPYFREDLAWDAHVPVESGDLNRAYYWRGIDVIRRNLAVLDGGSEADH